MDRGFYSSCLLAGSGIALVCEAPAMAQTPNQLRFALPAQDLGKALQAVSLQSGRNILAPSELVRGRQAPALSGTFTPETAVQALLAGSGLTVRRVGASLVIVSAGGGESPGEKASAEAARAESNSTIVVTGTRLRGAPVASPVIRLARRQIKEEGQATLAEAVRTIPQNFGGGQNPGIGNNVPQSNGVNVGSATSVNLRGLGSDATLTLLNGHRLSYSASRQAIDISAIPLGAVDRIEILPDGASALYGSDAVAGVVNVILRRDYQGLETSARLGTSTAGGGFEQRYSAVAGTTWTGGGMIAAYEFGRTTAIEGRDRSYAADRPALTLFPFLRGHSATISAHQELAPGLRFEVDGLYNNRLSRSAFASNAAGDIDLSGTRFAYRSEAFVIAPTLAFDAGADWRLFATGSYGEDRTHYDVTNIFGGTVFRASDNCYCNQVRAAEAGASGRLFELPGGPVRLAAGIGFRGNRLVRFNGEGADTNVSAKQDSYYAYGELNLPFVSEAQNVPLVHSLNLSAALRYEDYPDAGHVATPKFGLIYAPTADFALKGSWGRSFRAPTLQQQFGARLAILIPPEFIGGTGFPAGATALVIDGGNPDLKPEHATSWSATLDVHPGFIPGARLELSYFKTRYRDRVVSPIQFLGQALSNPFYQNRLTLNPGAALLDQVIAGAVSFTNATGAPYDPADVAVLVDNGNTNAAHQTIEGADLLFTYRTSIGDRGDGLTIRLNATYLNSDQKLAPEQPTLPLAGILFNPPHVRGRAGLSWDSGPFTATGNLTYIGGVDDTRRSSSVRIGSMTMLDLTLLYRSPAASGPFEGLDISLSAQNLLDDRPDRIATTLFSDAPYDSTNYSPLGRFVAFAITKRW